MPRIGNITVSVLREESAATGNLIEALCAAQPEFPPIPLDSDGFRDGHSYRYASISAIRRAVVPALAKHGIWMNHVYGENEGGDYVVTMLRHKTGEYITSTLRIPHISDVQDRKGAMTLLCRTAIEGLLSISTEEDTDASDVQSDEPQEQQPVVDAATKERWLNNLALAEAAVAMATDDATLTRYLGYSVFLGGDNSAFAGTFVHQASNLYFNTPFAGSALAAWVINGGGQLGMNFSGNAVVRFGSLAGTSGVIHGGYVKTGTKTIEVGALGTSTTYAGRFIDFDAVNGGSQIAVRKIGSGTFTLSAASTHSGATEVLSGVLTVTGSLAASNVLASNGGAFKGVAAASRLSVNGLASGVSFDLWVTWTPASGRSASVPYQVVDGDLPPLNVATFRARISGWCNPREGNRCHEERSIRRSRSSANSERPKLSWLGARPCPRWCGSLG